MPWQPPSFVGFQLCHPMVQQSLGIIPYHAKISHGVEPPHLPRVQPWFRFDPTCRHPPLLLARSLPPLRLLNKCHVPVVVRETLPLVLHLLSKASVTSMIALLGPTASIPSCFVSPPLAPLGQRPRSSSLASIRITMLIFECLCGRLIPESFSASPFKI